MNIEIREDSVLITGYVNAVERLSKPIREKIGGKIRTFLERIKAGVFRKALERNDNVLVLLNHDPKRVLATTKDGSAKLEEDTIGLRAEITITDTEVVEKAREGRLSGWSFGFYCNDEEMGKDNEDDIRTVTDLDLVEVSILDDTKEPAYYGTLIEAREEGGAVMEIRADEFKREDEAINIDDLAEIIADKVASKLAEKTDDAEATETEEPEEVAEAEEDPEKDEEPEEEAPAEEEPAEESEEAEEEPKEDEARSIDYSSWEKRLAEISA